MIRTYPWYTTIEVLSQDSVYDIARFLSYNELLIQYS